MSDDSMHPRFSKGDFALLDHLIDLKSEIGKEVLLQLDNGVRCVRKVVECSESSVTLSTYNRTEVMTIERQRIAASFCVDMIVPPPTFALMTEEEIESIAEACYT